MLNTIIVIVLAAIATVCLFAGLTLVLAIYMLRRLERFLKGHKNVLSTMSLLTQVGGLLAGVLFGMRKAQK